MPELTPSRTRWFAHPVFRWSTGIIIAVILGIVAFEALQISVFSAIGMPHEFCYIRNPKLIGLHAVSDLLIGLGYVSISVTLGYLVCKASQSIPFNWVFLAFGLFIISCGFTHFMEVWVIWHPVYWLSGYIKVITAAASVATAIALFPLLPRIFRLIEGARQSERRRLEIERLNEDLARFNYSVAHDLRSPLHGIAGFTQALREDFRGQLPPDADVYLDRIHHAVGRMDALISDLLSYAKIGRQDIQLRPVRLDEPVAAAIGLLEADITRRHAEIATSPGRPEVVGDSTLLQVVIQNLVANGIKFVAEGVRPRVQITSEARDGHVTLSVTDNGIGIPPEAHERIFGLFERFHPHHAGTGIGLAIVQRAVERMHGELGFEAAAGGTGTRFWIRLPVAH